MRNTLQRTFVGLLVVALLLCTAGCSVELQGIEISPSTLYLNEIGATAKLSVTYRPNGATSTGVTWSSKDTSIATVDNNGKVTAKKSGKTEILAVSKANSKLTATAAVDVLSVAVTGVKLNKSETSLNIGNSEKLVATVYPSNASTKNCIYTSSDPLVVGVGSDGTIIARGSGLKNSATVTVQTEAGGFKASCKVNIEANAHAYVVANSDYQGENNDLPGVKNDGENMVKLLTRNRFNTRGDTWQVSQSQNAKKSDIHNMISQIAKIASTSDRFLFYYSGHGSYNKNTKVSYICTTDSSDANWLSVAELKKELDSVPGEKIVILDCCYSGNFIDKAPSLDNNVQYDEGTVDQFMQGVMNVFGTTKSLAQSGYHVLTACSGIETSMEDTVFVDGQLQRQGAFTYSLLCGSGYYTPGMIPADINSDKLLSVKELYNYLKQNVKSSTVQHYSNSLDTTVFAFK